MRFARSFRVLAPVLALAALAGCAAPPPRIGLGETEVRRPVDIEAAPWRSVGAVVTAVGARCTGALVGPRQVLTAAHCLLDPRTAEPLPPGAVDFVTGLAPGQGGVRAGVASYVMGPGFAARPGPLPDPAAPPDSDWAVLTLEPAFPDQPLERLLPIAPGFARPGVRLAFGGYQADNADRLVADLSCAVLGYGRDAAGRLMLRHSCAGTGGSSGGPLLVQPREGGWLVAGVGSMATRGAQGGWAVPAAAILRAAGAKPTGS